MSERKVVQMLTVIFIFACLVLFLAAWLLLLLECKSDVAFTVTFFAAPIIMLIVCLLFGLRI